jgi:hypothetical protein
MKRAVVACTVITAILAVAVVAELQLGKVPRNDPLGRELLYLPSPEMVKIMSLGHPGLAADVLYLWSIQYYSLFEPHERFLYLETIYNLITDLDPRYFDAYRIGALIMQIQTGGNDQELELAVRRLFDKGLRNLPENWQLAEAAAWDFFIRFKDRQTALYYAEQAVSRPGAPPRIKRMVGVWRDKEGVWTVHDSIEYWRRALAAAEDEMDEAICRMQLYDAVAARDRAAIEPVLDAFARHFGHCPQDWGELIGVGALRQVPMDAFGDPYGIQPEDCSLVAFKKFKDQ